MDHQSGSVTYRQLGNVWRKIPQLAPCLDIAIGNEYVIIKTKFVLVSKSTCVMLRYVKGRLED